MSVFDSLFFSIIQSTKTRFKKRSNTMGVLYITILQSSIILLLGAFFAAFFNQMNVSMMSATKAWVLFGLTCLIVYFKNWIQYTGKKRNILNAKRTKTKTSHYSVWVIVILPLGCILLSILLLKSVS
ncbi:hypothetical protein A9Q87_10200 [Flavobacteriales bacterium 34_180_T64]|nr:hypothetical protein A9Q87_10200 [Flavobacteriales bacterium 34_180_T64]